MHGTWNDSRRYGDAIQLLRLLRVAKMPIADGEDLNYPMLYYLIKLSLFAGAFLFF